MAGKRHHKVGKKHSGKRSKKSHSKVRLEPTLKHMGAHKGKKMRKSIRRKKG